MPCNIEMSNETSAPASLNLAGDAQEVVAPLTSLALPLSPTTVALKAFCAIHPHNAPAIHRLPVELLGEIFSLASVPSTSTNSRRSKGTPFEVAPHTRFQLDSSPMNVTHVNRQWREVTLSMPLLWSTLQMRGCLDYHPELVETWLERSGNCPLTISLATQRLCYERALEEEAALDELAASGTSGLLVTDTAKAADPQSGGQAQGCDCQFRCPVHDDARVSSIVATLVKRASRWQNVNFHFSMHHPTDLLSLAEGQLSSLKAAEFQHNNSWSSSIDPSESALITKHELTFWKATLSAPLLNSILIHKILPAHVPWLQLQDLTLSFVTDPSILSQCTQLVSLTLKSCFPPTKPATLPNLTYLKVQGIPLDTLIVPALKHLTLAAPSVSSGVSGLMTCLEQSSARLSSLTFRTHACWSTPEDAIPHHPGQDPMPLLTLLKSGLLDSLSTFTMTDCPVPRSLVHALSLEDGIMLPNLEHIALGCAADLPDESLVRLVAARHSSKQTSELIHLTILFYPLFSSNGDVPVVSRKTSELDQFESDKFTISISTL